jgi:hypothetical protein
MAVNERYYRGFHNGRGDATFHERPYTGELLVPTAYRGLHFASAADADTDWNVANQTHPTLYIHSETTPATDYVSIAHDGTSISFTAAGATNFAFDSAVVTMDQGAADTNHISLRSSDVATVLTTIVLGPDVTTSDYFAVGKLSATLGGAYVQSLAESGATESLEIDAWGGSPATTDTSSSLGCINIFGGEHDGANADADMASNSNLLCVGEISSSNARLTRMLLKADDGELHLGNSTLVALDAEDDVQAVRAMQRASTDGNGIIEGLYDPSNPFYNYEKLREMHLVGEKDTEGFYLFPVQPRLALHEGAIWQLYNDLMGIAQVLPRKLRDQLSERMQSRLALVGA